MKPILLSLVFFSLISCTFTNSKTKNTLAKEIVLEAVYNKPDGIIPTLEQLHGKVVVLDFWATWCAPCIAAFPKISELHNKYHTQDVVFIGITDDPKKKLENFLNELNVPFWIANDSDRSAFDDYGIKGIPHYVVVNKKGSVVYSDNFFEEAILKEIIETDTYTKEKTDENNEASASTGKASDFENTVFYPGQDPAYMYAYKLMYGKEAPFSTTHSFVIRPSLYQKKVGSGISYNGKTTSITYPYCTLTDFLQLSQNKSSALWIENEMQDSIPHFDIIYAKNLSISDAYNDVEKAFLSLTKSKLELVEKTKEVKKLVLVGSKEKLFAKEDLPKGAEKLYTSVASFLRYLEKPSGNIHVLEDVLRGFYIPSASLTFEGPVYKADYKDLINSLSRVGIEIIDAQQEIEVVVVHKAN